MLDAATKASMLAKYIRFTEKDTDTSKSTQMYVRTSKSHTEQIRSVEKEQIGMEMEKSIKRRELTRNSFTT